MHFQEVALDAFINWVSLLRHGSYNLEKVLNFGSRLEKSFNLVKVLEKYLIFFTRS